MFYWLAEFKDVFGPFRLFEYVTFRAAGAGATAMLLTILLGPLTIKLLKRLGTNAPNRHEGLMDEKFIDRNKDKTPSMGGVLIVAAIAISSIAWGMPGNSMIIAFVGTLLAFGTLGFIDDYAKVKGNRDGIAGKVKLLLQAIIAIAAIVYLDSLPETAEMVLNGKIQPGGGLMRQLMVPFLAFPLIAGWGVILFSMVVMVGSSNAVNLTDGKDGLAVGTCIFCALAYAVFAYTCGHKIFASYLNVPFIAGSSEVVVFATAIAGACIGFLWYNCYPASVFMGDTGSLALGGSIGLIAVLVRQELTLLIVGFVFVMEALSVIIQVASFKLTGKRVFLCTPIHHHFEQKGWTETQIVARFWIIAGVAALAGLATLKLR
ncbi:MAG: phospho-N-acetylmuramoyl-pentapeptide-transferase [Victivallaceae bacterium]|nr:phospho-N-acetylmuramoyl-pentapeptide-transferase [Victivallaceae bacterium]